jgi:uncharacterized protein (DUF433 family)
MDEPLQRSALVNSQEDVREVPNYSVTEAARCLQLPRTTLRQWAAGRRPPHDASEWMFEPLLCPASRSPLFLSFMNLVEAHVLSALRREHQIRLAKIRVALAYLSQHMPSPHPLADQHFETDGLSMFIERYGQLIDIGQAGQLAMRAVLETYLRRIERDAMGLAVRLYPFTTPNHTETSRSIVIDPTIAFGRPVLARRGIPTVVIAQRYKAGESMDSLVKDYGCEQVEIEEAIRCELHLKAA